MSYSFSVSAATKEAASKMVGVELAKVVESQPIHEADRQGAQSAADGIINSLADPGEGQEILVNVYGSVSWSGTYPDSHSITAANVSASASVRLKP